MEPSFTKANKYLFDPKAFSWNLPSGTESFGLLENGVAGKLKRAEKKAKEKV